MLEVTAEGQTASTAICILGAIFLMLALRPKR